MSNRYSPLLLLLLCLPVMHGCAQPERRGEPAAVDLDAVLARFGSMEIADLAREPDALAAGAWLYGQHCAVCHGSDADGGAGGSSLRDGNWLWGGAPRAIRISIARGRSSLMPGMVNELGEQGLREVTEFTLQLAGREHDPALAAAGAGLYRRFCADCHGGAGQGNAALGAADLRNDLWVHGGSRESIADVIRNGRSSRMPAQLELLGEERIRLLSAWVHSLNAPP